MNNISSVLRLSNSHLDFKAQTFLARRSQRPGGNPSVVDTGYGFILVFDSDYNYRGNSIPENLVRIIEYAQDERCSYIHFDCDEEAIDDLPQYGYGA